MTRKTCKNFDVLIVGAGPAGLFAACYLAENTGLSVLVIEKGKNVEERSCPIKAERACRRCRPCNILSGIGGAGLFSDGKLNFIHKLGKTDLTQFLSRAEAEKLIDETEAIFNRFGMDGPVYPTDWQKAKDIRQNARRHGIELLLIRQKHLGSDNLPGHIAKLTAALKNRGVVFHSGEEAVDILVKGKRAIGLQTDKKTYKCRYLLLAPGRVGAEWLQALAARRGIGFTGRGIEVGVRVEVHHDILAPLTDIIYDPTFFILTSSYEDQVRTFCTNRQGFVSLENYQGFACVNGHAYMDRKSENSNFAFLSKVVLTEPVSDNRAYGESIGRLATIIGGRRPTLQRFGDLNRCRRSTWNRIRKGYIEPTLKEVTCGDIAMALPFRIVQNIKEGLERLNLVVPGVANGETLLYAPEIKFFATQMETDRNLQTEIKNLYLAGDGPGLAGNIVSAAATGLLAAKAIAVAAG